MLLRNLIPEISFILKELVRNLQLVRILLSNSFRGISFKKRDLIKYLHKDLRMPGDRHEN